MPLDAGAVRAAVLAETNAYRASKNIPQLQKNAALEAAATAYAVYLAEHEKMGHTADGSNPPKRVSAQGYKVCFISENVWSSFRHSQTMLDEELARKAMDGWKKSPGHNANLLQKRAHDIGAQCRSNRGAPGVDGQDFAAVEEYGLKQWLGELALALRACPSITAPAGGGYPDERGLIV